MVRPAVSPLLPVHAMKAPKKRRKGACMRLMILLLVMGTLAYAGFAVTFMNRRASDHVKTSLDRNAVAGGVEHEGRGLKADAQEHGRIGAGGDGLPDEGGGSYDEVVAHGVGEEGDGGGEVNPEQDEEGEFTPEERWRREHPEEARFVEEQQRKQREADEKRRAEEEERRRKQQQEEEAKRKVEEEARKQKEEEEQRKKQQEEQQQKQQAQAPKTRAEGEPSSGANGGDQAPGVHVGTKIEGDSSTKPSDQAPGLAVGTKLESDVTVERGRDQAPGVHVGSKGEGDSATKPADQAPGLAVGTKLEADKETADGLEPGATRAQAPGEVGKGHHPKRQPVDVKTSEPDLAGERRGDAAPVKGGPVEGDSATGVRSSAPVTVGRVEPDSNSHTPKAEAPLVTGGRVEGDAHTKPSDTAPVISAPKEGDAHTTNDGRTASVIAAPKETGAHLTDGHTAPQDSPASGGGGGAPNSDALRAQLTQAVLQTAGGTRPPAQGLYAMSAVDIDGKERALSEFAGKVTVVVNVASACGYTDENYKGLQKTYEKYQKHGLEILGFPCNQFGKQEPGTLADIKAFCSGTYHVTFPMFSKVDVNGPSTHPVYQFLKRELPEAEGGGGGKGAGKDLIWNFQKILVDHTGKPVKLFYQNWDTGLVENEIYRMLHEARDAAKAAQGAAGAT